MALIRSRWTTNAKTKADLHMRRTLNNLYKYAKKAGLTYISTTVLIDEESEYVGFRTKSGKETISDEHCFKEWNDGNME